MKKLLTLLILLTACIACSSDNDSEEEYQEYTSFVVTTTSTNNFSDCVAGYYTKDGLCKKIGDLGKITQGVFTKEIIVEDPSITSVYIFYDLYDLNNKFTLTGRADTIFILKPNIKNKFILDNFEGIAIEKDDKYHYPQ